MRVRILKWELEVKLKRWVADSHCPRTGAYFPTKEYHDANCIACQPYQTICGHTISPDEKCYLWHGKCDACQTPEERQERDEETAKFLAK